MSKVFVVQESKHNISFAEEYGDIVIMAKIPYPVYSTDNGCNHISYIGKFMKDYRPAEDYILLVGDPINIGIVMAFALQLGPVRVLKWDNQANRYIQTVVGDCK